MFYFVYNQCNKKHLDIMSMLMDIIDKIQWYFMHNISLDKWVYRYCQYNTKNIHLYRTDNMSVNLNKLNSSLDMRYICQLKYPNMQNLDNLKYICWNIELLKDKSNNQLMMNKYRMEKYIFDSLNLIFMHNMLKDILIHINSKPLI